MPITSESTLTDCAFVICTAMHKIGSTFVLVGGSAATYYAPESYQSKDLDFCMLVTFAGKAEAEALAGEGYFKQGSVYHHPANPYTVDLMHEHIYIDQERITEWNTIHRGDEILHVLIPEDVIRDRLIWYGQNDISALRVAASVLANTKVAKKRIEQWCAGYFENGREVFEDLISYARKLENQNL